MTEASNVRLWHTLTLRDADTMIGWLTAIGFTEHATYRDEGDPSVIQHAEWLWPDAGGIMLGTRRDDSLNQGAGPAAAYVVTSDPDAVFDRAVAAGATVVREMVDQDYGGRGGSVRDPEGNLWSFGDYQPS